MKSLYMTAIVPPAEQEAKIRELQHEFSEAYGSAAALRPPVHITVTPPRHLEEAEVALFSKAAETIANRNSFEVSIDGFDFFKRNRVVFLRVLPEPSLYKMQSHLASLLGVEENRPYRPHITIGYRDITKSAFNRIMRDYERRSFHARFQVKEIQLWKHEDKRWQKVDGFDLK